jgi:hypothetical protein
MALFQGRDRSGTNFDFYGAGDSSAFTLATTEPTSSAVLGEGGVTVTTSSTTVKTATAGRRAIEVSNGGDSGVWVHFGASTATAGQGSFLPPNSANRWAYSAYSGEVRAISASGSNAVGYVEW